MDRARCWSSAAVHGRTSSETYTITLKKPKKPQKTNKKLHKKNLNKKQKKSKHGKESEQWDVDVSYC